MNLNSPDRDARTEAIIACAIEVHAELGPGLLEVPYEAAMCIALHGAGHVFERQKPFPAMFRGVQVGQYRPDLIVNNEVIVE
jgi:GxxExxY protein